MTASPAPQRHPVPAPPPDQPWVDVRTPLLERLRGWLTLLLKRLRRWGTMLLEWIRHALKPSGPHETLTVITPILHDRLEPLRAVLQGIDDNECRKGICPLRGVNGVHIARWTILPRAVRASGVEVPETLVFWTVFDGSRDAHLGALTTAARAQIDAVYRHCEGYPAGGTPADVQRYLTRNSLKRGWKACFDGTPGRSVEQIVKEQLLHEYLRDFLTKEWGDVSLSHIHLAAKRWAASDDAFSWALEKPEIGYAPKPWPLVTAAGLAPLLVCSLVFGLGPVLQGAASAIAALVVIASLWLVTLRRAERRATRRFVAASREWFAKHDDDTRLRENEDSGINRLTILTDVHTGWIRALTIRAVLWIVNFRAKRVLDGKLQGVETIHFAQWRLVDRGRRLLFMSNYDHRWDDYFRAFSDNAAPGVNAIWSNTVGFPPTYLLIGEGSRDLPLFQKSARTYQIPTDVWYFGYPKRSLTMRRINENTRIREGLSQSLTPPEVREWLELVFADGS